MRTTVSTITLKGLLVQQGIRTLQYEAVYDPFERRWENVEILTESGNLLIASDEELQELKQQVEKALEPVINSFVWL